MYSHGLPIRRLVATAAMLLATAASLAGAANVVHASPLAPASVSTASSPTMTPAEGFKATLDETSIDGPTLWTSDTGSVRAVIAWTGTDPDHRLNLLTSADGVTWGNKATFDETSSFHPSVARTGPNSTDSAVVAWTGIDPNHSLNVLMGNSATNYLKLTLWDENSFTAPSITVLNGSLYLVWAGTDDQHSLNVDQITVGGGKLTVQQKTILWGWSSLASPALVADPTSQQLLMSWAGPNGQLHFATSSDGAHWTQPSRSPITETSDAGPALFSAQAGNVSSNLPRYFFTWRGTDPAHSVNVKYTTAFPQWPQTYAKATLNEQAFGGTMLGSLGASGQLLLAWSGVDPQHHLNVASVAVAYAAACVPPSGVKPVSPDVISRGTPAASEVSLTFDSDGGSAGNANTYLDILHNHHVHVTFFLTGAFAQANPAVVQRIVSEGDDIGNHTADHPDLANPARTDTFVCNELTGANGTISGIAGRSTTPYFRPPYGSYNEQVQYLAAGMGYRTMLWNIDPADWDPTTTVQDILNRVLNSPNLGPGAIILMHVNSVNEPQALDGVITGLQQRGYTIVPLSQLLQ